MSERTKVTTGDTRQPPIRVQGGYVPTAGAAPKPPKGGSSFKPATASTAKR